MLYLSIMLSSTTNFTPQQFRMNYCTYSTYLLLNNIYLAILVSSYLALADLLSRILAILAILQLK